MKLQIKLLDDGIPFDDIETPIPVIDHDGNHLGNLTGAQRFVGRGGEPRQVVLTMNTGTDAQNVFAYIWEKAMGRERHWLKNIKLRDALTTVRD
jgi:hypothetical protein